jgi:hypothetical protein
MGHQPQPMLRRRGFIGALGSLANYGKLAMIFAVSTAGLLLYNVSLSHAHPVVVVAILNLAPFWGAIVALLLTRTPIPVSPFVFFGCLVLAFAGATAVAWSQAKDGAGLVAELWKGTRIVGAALVGLAILSLIRRALAQEVHYSPEERLDAIDAALIATAKSSIDLASYALTDSIVIDALDAAERRGVAIRIVLDPREGHDFVKLGDLSDNVRIKRGGPFNIRRLMPSMEWFCAPARRTSARAARTRRTTT